MSRDERPKPIDTAAPARNFALPVEERVRALTAGVPAYVRRRRQIEDLEREIVLSLAAARAKLRALRPDDDADAIDREVLARFDRRPLARLHGLIERHNRYFPVEANLPMQPLTGVLLERGAPWRPMPLVTLEELLARAAR